MADNTTLNAGTGGDTLATDDIAGVKYQRVKVSHGADGTANETTDTSPLPIKLTDGTDTVLVNASGELQVDDDAGNALLATIDADTSAMVTALQIIDNIVSGSEAQVDIVTMPAITGTVDLGATDNAVLDAIAASVAAADTDLTTIIGHVDGLEGLLGTIDADTGAIKTAVEILDNAIAGSEMQVDVVTSALPTGAATEATLLTIDADTGAIKTAVEILDNAIAGSEMQVDVVAALPAGTNLVGRVSASHETNTIYDAATALTPKFLVIAAASSGNNTLLAAVSGKKIRVLSYSFVCAAAVSVRFESGADGTALTGVMAFAANGGISVPFNPVGHFETGSNVLLNLELSGAFSVAGHLTYVEV